ncbi:MAG: valine--tRNA ligase, partial [Syntrophobacterales bacterium]
TKIVPPMWEGTYFDWMENIRDWCISRQIWWGHRIPVWYCAGCGKIIVAVEDPRECPDCGEASLSQDEDVLDTWFSSALWPFSTLGWPDKTDALETFYPTSLLITGFDIIFFWVARMMMMGLYIMKDVPFNDVYLHALVRDEEGSKMSKSKGNVIDPLEMIDKYGADAFRFTLSAFTAQGRDVKMSEARIEGYQHFVNKIWNTARFTLMNLDDYAGDEADLQNKEYSLADRWIKDVFNRTTEEVIRCLDEYRFNDAAGAIYQFVWHELCDWYLEMIKPILYGKNSPESRHAAQETLSTVFEQTLKLLHPFIPFVTEEIWQKMKKERVSSIMVSRFPEENKSYEDNEAFYHVNVIKEITGNIRNIRGVMNIPPSKKLSVLVSVPDKELRSILDAGREYIIDLAKLEKLSVEGTVEEPKGVATGIVGAMKIYVFLEGMVDIAAERARLEKEMKKLERDLSIVSKKLNNRDFMEKASEAVIRKEETKFVELKEKNGNLEEALKKLKEIEE